MAPTGLRLSAAMYDLAGGSWLAGQPDDTPEVFGADGYVLILPGRQQFMSAGEDGKPDLPMIVETIQEWAIDELGYGWPELQDDRGGFVALLEPAQTHDGCVWAAHGSPRAAVGELSSLAVRIPRRKD